MFHMQAKTAEEQGNFAEAAEYRRQARRWNIRGIIGGIVVWIICVFFLILAIGLGIFNGIIRAQADELLDHYS